MLQWLARRLRVRRRASQTSAPAPPAVVQVTKAVRRTVPITAEYIAQTQALQAVDLVPRVEGVLEHVYFQNGSLVRKGQVLMQIQQAQYQAGVQAAQGSLDKAQADLVRAKSNVQNETAACEAGASPSGPALSDRPAGAHETAGRKSTPFRSKTTIKRKRSTILRLPTSLRRGRISQDVELNQKTGILSGQGNVEEAKAQLANAQLDLSYTTIASPVTGIISFVKVDQGNVVSPAKTPSLATVSTIDPIRVDLQLSESDYLQIAGRLQEMRDVARRPQLQLYLSDGSLYPYKGTPVAINRAVDPTTGTISVESIFRNPQALLRPGQFGRVRLPISQQRQRGTHSAERPANAAGHNGRVRRRTR